jgi:hypothetical protein
VSWLFVFFFPSILSRIIANPADLVENLTHIIHLCINKSVDHVFLFSRTRIGNELRKGKPTPSGAWISAEPRPFHVPVALLPDRTESPGLTSVSTEWVLSAPA